MIFRDWAKSFLILRENSPSSIVLTCVLSRGNELGIDFIRPPILKPSVMSCFKGTGVHLGLPWTLGGHATREECAFLQPALEAFFQIYGLKYRLHILQAMHCLKFLEGHFKERACYLWELMRVLICHCAAVRFQEHRQQGLNYLSHSSGKKE